MSAAVEYLAHDLYDRASEETDAVVVARVLFPGLRQLTPMVEDAAPVIQRLWYNAPATTHVQTLLFVRFLNEELLGLAASFLESQADAFSDELLRVHKKDFDRFARAVNSLNEVVTEQTIEESRRAKILHDFVFSQPNLQENVERMRQEYQRGERIRFSDTGLNRKKP